LIEIIAAARGCSPRTARVLAATAAFAPSAEQDQIAGHNFGHIFLLSGLLVIPRAGLQAAFDENLAAFLQIFSRDLGEALPEHNVVPLGAVLPLAGFVFEALVGGDRQLGHGRALRRVFDFGILAQIADQLNTVQTLSSHKDLLYES